VGNSLKYQNFASFEKHLEESAATHPSKVYLVLSLFDSDRKWMMRHISQALVGKDVPLCSFHAAETPLSTVLDQFHSLAISPTCLLYEGIEKLAKERLEQLARSLSQHFFPSPYLVLGASTLKGCPNFYPLAKKELVVLDLSEEKFWERQKRIALWLIHLAKKEGKLLPQEGANLLIERTGPDLFALELELQKQICFVGEAKEITSRAISLVSSLRAQVNLWQIAEQFVWAKKILPRELLEENSFLFPLIAQVRQQLQLGAKFSSFIERKADYAEIAAYFSHLKPQNVARYLEIAKERGPLFFKRGLTALFEVELNLKSSAPPPALLWEVFTAHLYTHREKNHALSSS